MINKRVIILSLFIFIYASVFSQINSAAIPVQHKVMIIPFNPFYYLSDADAELAAYNKKTQSEISTLFRYGLDMNVNARVITSYNAQSILMDTTVESAKDLQFIYSNISYKYEKPMDINGRDSMPAQIKETDLFGINGPPPNEKKKLYNQTIVEDTVVKKYLNAVVNNTELFSALQQKYGADLFIFINQFELVTNYAHCLDRATNNFERKVLVHYSIYDATGRQLKGDAVSVTFPSNMNNLDAIIAEKFPLIGNYLRDALTTSITPQTVKKKK